ncbi:YycH family regulatory protein [Bacillus tuaregi]|uniref:YycH family regulatory protein n=1 Tax=Bacillus tuaregi TaxID=1816695 RepID=UPI0008F90AC8|nr:two-component system activity regulator YycH [Bacillus tuaregi]
MTYESIKSIILTILVGLSLLLTWSLWTYQPNYEELGNGETVQEVSFSPKKTIKEIVKPEQIIFHSAGAFYGTLTEDNVDQMINEISTWNYSGFERISFEAIDIYSLTDNQEAVEILFPSPIMMNVYKNVLGVKEKDVPNFQFSQIIIPLNIDEREHGVVYFVSQEDKTIYRSIVTLTFIADFKGAYYEASKAYRKYFPHQTASGHRIYLPEEEIELFSYQHLSAELDSNKFKNALFDDPSLVQKNNTSTGVEYKDASSLMKVNPSSNLITYIDPSEVGSKEINTSDMLKRSIDFVNGHGGWTDSYRFVGMDSELRTVNFRLYGQEGYPIFSENTPAISKIQLVWGNTDISRYKRNNFYFDILTTSSSRTLESGAAVLEKIESLDQFNSDLLEDIKIGYSMEMNAQSLLIDLEPCWYYYYNGIWKSLDTKEHGGETHGLE